VLSLPSLLSFLHYFLQSFYVHFCVSFYVRFSFFMSPFSRILIGASLLACAIAAPASFAKRASSSGVASALAAVDSAVSGVLNGLEADASEASQIYSALLTAVEDSIKSQVTATPTNIPQATSVLASILSTSTANQYGNIVKLAANGFGPSISDLTVLMAGTFLGPNSENNINLMIPNKAVYPKRGSSDAPYTLSEAQLRKVIYIPPTFTYGRKPPVIVSLPCTCYVKITTDAEKLVPGTGGTGYESFDGNFITLLTGVSYADPVWLNIPGQLLGDIQVNAEYVAYAINYINGITSKNVSVISWSQGCVTVSKLL
jgi:hypothetical protein